MIQIKNLRVEKPTQPYDVKVDRTSILGNPFYMDCEEKRYQVCEQYKEYIVNKLKNKDEKIIAEFKRLKEIYLKYGKLNLFCWCYPKQCHAETIKQLIKISLNKK